MDNQDLYEALIEQELFTEDELDLLLGINGNTIETFDDAAYYRYGERCAETLAGLTYEE